MIYNSIKYNKMFGNKLNINININNFLLKKNLSHICEKNRKIHFEQLYFNSFKIISKNKKIKLNKYESIKTMIFNNKFLKNEQKTYLLDIFNKYQKCFFAFKKFIFIYKWNKAEYYNNTCDLIGNSYNNLHKNQLITILQNNKKYIFRASDILNIWKNDLFHSSNMESKPKFPKSPYSNILFKKHNLYNIYFHIKFNTIITIPIIIQRFFNSNFSINTFAYMNYVILFNNSVNEYIKNMEPETIFFELNHMFSKDKIFKKYRLNFSNLNLERANELKTILRYYILSNYIIHPLKKKFYTDNFIRNANRYIKKNKNYLRRYVRTTD